jgi:hypothetical protein
MRGSSHQSVPIGECFLIGKTGHSLEHMAFKGKTVNCPKPSQNRDAGSNGNYSEPLLNLMDPNLCQELVIRILESAGLHADDYRTTCLNRRLIACLRGEIWLFIYK